MATNPYHNEAVPMHKRIAAGEKLDGTSLKSQGQPANKAPAQKGGALSQAKKK
jgi:hypothetical protein